MSPDEAALLAAVAADPADDTPRLVYADWLDENGQPERAEFVRVQVEAERHHRDTLRRRELDARARELLEKNWVGWWSPMCGSVGLPTPEPARPRLGWFGRQLGLGTPAGMPYQLYRGHVTFSSAAPYDLNLNGFERATFRRGFPSELDISCHVRYREANSFVPRWPAASPLTRLRAAGLDADDWADLDGPHLRGLQAVELVDHEFGVAPAILRSPHLSRLEELELGFTDDPVPGFAVELAGLISTPEFERVRRLVTPCYDAETATTLAYGGVGYRTALELYLQPAGALQHPPFEPWAEAASERVAMLARSTSYCRLRELTIHGWMNAAGYVAVSTGATWKGLRKLVIEDEQRPEQWAALLRDADLPVLEELRFGWSHVTTELLELMVQSPLLKQLKHLSIGLWSTDAFTDADWRRLAEIVDADRIETFALNPDHVTPGVRALERRLGDRLRLP